MKLQNIIKLTVILVVAVLAASFLNGIEYVLLVGAAAAIHEAGHIIAAKLLKVPSLGGGGTFFGLSLKYDFSTSSFAAEALVSAAGALAGVIACVITLAIKHPPGTYAVFFIFSNLSLALFNLLPVSPLDGSGIVRSLLSMVLSADAAEKASAWISAVFSLSFFVFCIYIPLTVGANLSLMFISVFLLYNALSTVRDVRGA